MRVEGRKHLAVHGFLLVLTFFVTSMVAFLVIPAEQRSGKFYVSLAAILGLQVFGFLFPLLLALKHWRRSGSFRINLATTVSMSVYSVGVLILVLLAFGPVSLSTVLALQLGWLLFFMLALGANAMGFRSSLARRQRAPLASVESQFSALCDRLATIHAKEAFPLKAEFAAVRTDLQYAMTDPVPEVPMVDTELNSCRQRMEQELAVLEAAANPRNIVPTSTPVSEAVSSLDWEIKRLKQKLKRREALVGQ